MHVLRVIIYTTVTLCFGDVIRDQCSRTSCPDLPYDESMLTYTHQCSGRKMIVDFQCINGYTPSNTRLTCRRYWYWYWSGAPPTCTGTTSSTTSTPSTSNSVPVTPKRSTITSLDTTGSLDTPLTTHGASLDTTRSSLQFTTQIISSSERFNSIRSSTTESTITTIGDSGVTQPVSCNGTKLLSKLANLNVFPLDSVILNLDNSTFPQGERIRYDCANNYRFINGTLGQVCGADGQWRGELPVCKRCKCPCSRMRNQIIIKSQEELQSKIDVITKQLKVEKSHLSSETNKKISAADPRPAAKAVGSILGIGILVFIVMFMVLSDVPTLYRHFRYGPYA